MSAPTTHCPHCGKALKLSPQQIIDEVALKHGFSPIEVTGSQRTKSLMLARQEAYYRCATETRASLTAIGRAFGGRDHGTVQKGIDRHKYRVGM